jgi:uncharacterized protein YjbI with pentapeptide repeats
MAKKPGVCGLERRITMNDKQAAPNRVNWRGADLRGVSMAGLNLEGADLRASDLSGASRNPATFLGTQVLGYLSTFFYPASGFRLVSLADCRYHAYLSV